MSMSASGERAETCGNANWSPGSLHPRQWHDLHDFYPCAGHLQMRMVFAEYLRCRIMSFGLHDRIASDLILCVRGSLRINALGLPQGRSALDNGCLIGIHPLHPGVHPFLPLLWSGVFHHLFELRPRSHIQRHKFLHRIFPCFSKTNDVPALEYGHCNFENTTARISSPQLWQPSAAFCPSRSSKTTRLFPTRLPPRSVWLELNPRLPFWRYASCNWSTNHDANELLLPSHERPVRTRTAR